MIRLYTFSILLLITYNISAQKNYSPSIKKLLAPDAKLERISDQFIFTEGPAVDKNGDVYFTDQPNDKIWKYEVKSGKLSLFMDGCGRSNGLYFDDKGNLLACADEKNELWSIDMKGNKTILLDGAEGRKFNGPNDVWFAPNGDIYFTDPYYHRPYWNRPDIQPAKEYVYLLKKGSENAVSVDDTLLQPNGIIGSNDGKWLFVADIDGDKTYRYKIAKNGTLKDKIEFAPMGSDGMILDKKGNLYLTGKGVTIFDKNGQLVGDIPVPSEWVGNVTLAGKKRDILFITASESVYVVKIRF